VRKPPSRREACFCPGAQRPGLQEPLDVGVARGDDVIVAYAMNGEPLPVLNGYVDDNFWMKTAYRIPDTPGNSIVPGATGYPTIPINRMAVRSFATNVADGAMLKAGKTALRGIAFDGGSGIKRVEVSMDGGTTWRDAALERDYGKYSFRRWAAEFVGAPGPYTLAVRATANDGATQQATPIWNPSGYLRNSIETYKVTVA